MCAVAQLLLRFILVHELVVRVVQQRAQRHGVAMLQRSAMCSALQCYSALQCCSAFQCCSAQIALCLLANAMVSCLLLLSLLSLDCHEQTCPTTCVVAAVYRGLLPKEEYRKGADVPAIDVWVARVAGKGQNGVECDIDTNGVHLGARRRG